jgi:hypothetical protein
MSVTHPGVPLEEPIVTGCPESEVAGDCGQVDDVAPESVQAKTPTRTSDRVATAANSLTLAGR